MVNLNINNEDGNLSARYLLQANDRIDNLTLGMLVNNDIEGIVSLRPVQSGSDRFFKYDLTDMVSLEKYFGEYVKKESLLKVFYGIAVAIKVSTEYMINWTSFVLDESNIYVNPETDETGLICIPLLSVINDGNTCNFFKNILFTAQFDPEENGDYVGRLITFLNPKTYTIDRFIYELEEMLGLEHRVFDLYEEDDDIDEDFEIEYIEDTDYAEETENTQTAYDGGIEEAVQNTDNNEGIEQPSDSDENVSEQFVDSIQEPEHSSIETVIQDDSEPDADDIDVSRETGNIMDEVKMAQEEAAKLLGNSSEEETKASETIVEVTESVSDAVSDIEEKTDYINQSYNAAEETSQDTYYDIRKEAETENEEPGAYLLRTKTNEKIYISKDKFSVGSDEENVDYYIDENQNIDDIHAYIIRHDNEYFVLDNNTKRGTYMNNVELMPDFEEYLLNGVHIRFADEEFEFRMHD